MTARRLFYFQPREDDDRGGTKHEALLSAVEDGEASAEDGAGRLRIHVAGEDVVVEGIQPPERAAQAAELVQNAPVSG